MQELQHEHHGIMNTTASSNDLEHRLVHYLNTHPDQRELSVGGLCAALQLHEKRVPQLIQAAFALASTQRSMLEVHYKLYDPLMNEVLEDVSQSEYEQSVAEGCFIDLDGYEVTREEFVRRARPCFVHRITPNGSLHDQNAQTHL